MGFVVVFCISHSLSLMLSARLATLFETEPPGFVSVWEVYNFRHKHVCAGTAVGTQTCSCLYGSSPATNGNILHYIVSAQRFVCSSTLHKVEFLTVYCMFVACCIFVVISLQGSTLKSMTISSTPTTSSSAVWTCCSVQPWPGRGETSSTQSAPSSHKTLPLPTFSALTRGCVS